MSKNREMSFISRTIAGISLTLVILLFSALVLTACNNDNAELIGEAKAEEIVLADAGLKPEEVKRMIIKSDYDDGQQIYELDFYTEDTEYEYDVDAKSGKILKYESEKRRM